MLRDLIALGAGATALFWGVVWLAYAPLWGLGWCALWLIALALDHNLHAETAPAPPVVVGELVEDDRLEPVEKRMI